MKKLLPAIDNVFSCHQLFKSSLALLFAVCISGTIIAQVSQQKGQGTITPATLTEKPSLSYKIIPAEQNSFGYDIFDANRKLIHQPSIPGLPGNKGFNKKDDAEKCARLVIHKINLNIMPPTVTKKELDSLQIKY
jgi:hypothetical protein